MLYDDGDAGGEATTDTSSGAEEGSTEESTFESVLDNDQQSQLDEMDDFLGGQKQATEKSEPEPELEKPNVDNIKKTATKDATDDTVAEETTDVDDAEEGDDEDPTVALADAVAKLVENTQGDVDTTEPKQEPKKDEPKQDLLFESIDLSKPLQLLKDEKAYTETIGSVEGMNKFGSDLAAVTTQRSLAAIVQLLPELVSNYTDVKIQSFKFQEANPELHKIMGSLSNMGYNMGKHINKIRKENPKMPIDKVFEVLKKEVTDNLNTTLKNTKKKPNKNGRGFANNKQTARTPTKQQTAKSDFELQSDEMDEVVYKNH